MPSDLTLLLAVLVLGVGTYALRFAGPALRTRVDLSPRVEATAALAALVLLAALVATQSVLADDAFAGVARPAGVVVGGVLAWRGAPFVLVVLVAAATAGGLRLLGVP